MHRRVAVGRATWGGVAHLFDMIYVYFDFSLPWTQWGRFTGIGLMEVIKPEPK